MSLDFVTIHCPYCGESFQTPIDASAGDRQHQVEDCAICCQPITVIIAVDADGEIAVRGLRGDDSG
jgi:hypothetical protein